MNIVHAFQHNIRKSNIAISVQRELRKMFFLSKCYVQCFYISWVFIIENKYSQLISIRGTI